MTYVDGFVLAVPLPIQLARAETRSACAPVQHFKPLLALAAADDLADPGCEHVHRCDGPAVVVEPHIDRTPLCPFG
jgi:uncharacterized protein YbaA (DUF1428 family)